MGMFYSAATGGFYTLGVHDSMPADAVAITPRRHAELMAAQAAGAAIVASPSTGRPVIQKSSADAATRRDALRGAIKREAARRIAAISPEWRQLNDMREPSDAGAVRFAQIDAVRAASGAIEDLLKNVAAAQLDTFPVRDNPLWPEIEGTA